jgi:hypothetical protein
MQKLWAHVARDTKPMIRYVANNKNYFPFFDYLALQTIESEEQQRLRFQVELEFVQCLANPNYLHCK